MGTNTRRRLQSRRHSIILAILLLAIPILFLQASSWAYRRGLAEVLFITEKGPTSPFYLRIASTPRERKKGLMYVKNLPEQEGMLFIFPEEAQQAFWMKNTYVSLDIIFVKADLTVLGVVKNAPILTELPQSVKGESQFVIEVAAGVADRYGIDPGTKVQINTPLPRAIDDSFDARSDM
jgi:uncharacterized protein